MCRAFDSTQQNNNVRQHGPLLAFHHSSSYKHSREGQHQTKNSGRPLPLAMIPDSQRYLEGNYTSSSRQPATFLDATKGGRGGAQREEAITDDEPSSISTQLSSITQPLTTKISSIANTIASSKTAQGRAILLLVAFLYGTLNVTLRAIYVTDGPPAASVLSLVRQCLSIFSFIPIFIASKNSAKKGVDAEESGEYWEGTEEQKLLGSNVGDNGGETIRPMWMSALELAFWNFGAQVCTYLQVMIIYFSFLLEMCSHNKSSKGLINAGLLSSPAARASFLTQTSVVLTPLISALAGESISSSVWGGCGLALLGLFMISTSTPAGVGDVDSALTTFNQGDAMILLGALSWSAYIFRTSKLANSYSELNLQFTKTALLAVMYGGWFVSTAVSTLASAGTSFLSTGWVEALTPLWSGWNSPVVWLLLAYSAVGPGAVADLLQQQGQKETSASESNIILTLESVFAAVCAFLLLGEVSSMQEIAGGLLIVAAAIFASK